ncbi:MAG: hypothetical protein A2Z81_00015 [Omnitrophica WOR_2 bacterium GWA2_45_18]|nr:MAG: hypothetical protein A2Z81_00015 [Omnitrophica WOR_2 bacterium GWA2_45_18]
MVGSLESHMAIAKALEVDITALYTNIIKKEDLLSLKTPKTMTDLFVGSEKSSYEILTSKIFSKKMMPILLKIEPNGRTNNEHNRPGTEKFIYVLDGKIDIKIKEETFTLGKNNTLYFDASADHYIMNKGTAVAKVIVIATPVVL